VVLHADFYRLKSEEEIDDAGVAAALWERGLLCLLEWTSLFPEFEAHVLSSPPGRVIRVNLAFGETDDTRTVQIAGSGV
jgi:tRNA A37 threonylcarbamoyladenosine biosynthesis protein TsaE